MGHLLITLHGDFAGAAAGTVSARVSVAGVRSSAGKGGGTDDEPISRVGDGAGRDVGDDTGSRIGGGTGDVAGECVCIGVTGGTFGSGSGCSCGKVDGCINWDSSGARATSRNHEYE